VGEWETYGINPRFFPEELIFHAQNSLEYDKSLLDILVEAYEKTNIFGSSTVLLAQCRNGRLSCCYLGDSTYMILREGTPMNFVVAHRSKEQQHSFNCPYQLTRLPCTEDLEKLAAQGQEKLVSLVKMTNLSNKDSPYQA
jgi:protein phosphatase PTC7